MIEVFSITKSTSSKKVDKGDNKTEERTIKLSCIFFIALILLLLAIIALVLLPVYNSVNSVLTVTPVLSNHTYNSNDLIAISSWVLSGVALLVTITMMIKEIHATKVSTLKAKIERKEKAIVELGQSWCVLYEAAKSTADKKLLDEERNKISKEMGDVAILFPSEVRRLISNNKK